MTHGQTDRHTDRQTDRQTQTDFIICPIAICYSYGTDKNCFCRLTVHNYSKLAISMPAVGRC